MKKPSDDDWEARRAQILGLGEHSARKSYYPALRRRIAELERTEAALRASEERLQLALRGAELGMWDWDVANNEIIYDERWAGMVGYTAAELGTSFAAFQKLIHPDDAGRVRDAVAQSLRGEDGVFVGEFRMHHKDGHLVWILAKGLVTERDAHGAPLRLCGTHLDITERVEAEAERRRLEAQVQHAQKLESLGVLAGGIAHDFNNLILVILGNAELALGDRPEPPSVRHFLDEIRTAATRASELTNQMLAYSGKGRFVVEQLHLNTLVDEIARLLEVSIPKKTDLRFALADASPIVEVDATQIRQVVMNLVTNAADALEGGSGVVTLTTGAMDAGRDYLAKSYVDDHLPAGRYAFLEVHDTGCGMDAATRQRLFEPFFTTKAAGRGLGMAAVLGIVRGHNGTISVRSTAGRGSTIRVLLPLSAGTDTRDQPAAIKPRADLEFAGTTVLAVDDEPDVRRLLVLILKRLGLDVLEASDGDEAVAMYVKHQDTIGLVMLDLTMPRMDGAEAATALRALNPDVKIVLSSGYNANAAEDQSTLEGQLPFLKKPYTVAALKAALRSALG